MTAPEQATAPNAHSDSTGRPPLRRSRTDRKVTGVAAGLAHYFDVDPILVRVGFVVVTIAGGLGGGLGILLYLACTLLIPDEDTDVTGDRFIDRHFRAVQVTSGAVLVLAALTSERWWGRGPWLLAAAIGVVTLVVLAARDGRWHSIATASPAGAQAAPTSTPDEVLVPTSPVHRYSTDQSFTAPPSETSHSAEYQTRPRRQRSALGALTVGAALLVVAVLVAIERSGAASIPTAAVFAAALAVVGCGLLVGAFLGRSRGLIVLGVLLGIATLVTSVVHLPPTDTTGSVTWTPVTVGSSSYEWGAGQTTLDLSRIPPGGQSTVSVQQGFGVVSVVVSSTTTTRLVLHVGAGTIDTQPGQQVSGINRNAVLTFARTSGATTPGALAGSITVTVNLGAGHVEVQHAAPQA